MTRTSCYRVTGDGDAYEETITCSINEAGLHELHSTVRPASLTVRLTERGFLAVDFRGDRNSILLLLYMGLGRMPFTNESGVFWSDEFDPNPLLNIWGRLWQDLVAPFVEMPTVHANSAITSEHNANGNAAAVARICTDLRPGVHGAVLQRTVPNRITIQLSRRYGIARIHSESRSGVVEAKIIHD